MIHQIQGFTFREMMAVNDYVSRLSPIKEPAQKPVENTK